MFETFWLEPTDRERRWLRRFADGPCPAMAGDQSAPENVRALEHSYHNAKIQIDDGPFKLSQRADDDHPYHYSPEPGDEPFARDQRWLQIAKCECGYEFTRADSFQVHSEAVYRRVDNGEIHTTRDAPVGALWNAWWYGDWAKGDDGLSIMCKLPGGHDWAIDGQASNCTRPGEAHHCWVRHGTFGDRLTVDKDGNTCKAGGGSIWVHKPVEWHGFLRGGRLLEVGET
jgi:hypothetical protein